MSPYECVSTGDNLGMLEVVRDSETIANIVGDAVDKNLSGVRRKRAAMKMVFKEDVVARWLKRECALRAEAEAKERDSARPSGGRQRSVSHAVRRSRDHDGDERKSSKAEAMRRAAGEISREMIARRRSRSGDVSTAAPMPALSTNQCVVGWCRCGGRVVLEHRDGRLTLCRWCQQICRGPGTVCTIMRRVCCCYWSRRFCRGKEASHFCGALRCECAATVSQRTSSASAIATATTSCSTRAESSSTLTSATSWATSCPRWVSSESGRRSCSRRSLPTSLARKVLPG